MPQLVPIQRGSVKDRIGFAPSVAGSVCESINTRSMQIFRKNRNRRRNNGVNHRLNPNFVSQAIVARNNFSVNAINSFMSRAMKTLGDPDNEDIPKAALRALATRVLSITESPAANAIEPAAPKYDMSVQKEICAIQVISLRSPRCR